MIRLLCFLLMGVGVFRAELSLAAADSLAVTLTEGTNMAAAVSPDKRTLAIDLQGTIWLVPVAGGVARPITDALGDCRQPAWSPDGNWLVFHAFWDGTYHIWMVNRQGTQRKQLTTGVYDDREPHWSPDGKRIVFSSDRSGNYDIWQLAVDSGQLTQLTKNSANEYNPAFSPDGTQLVYVSERTEAPGLYRLDARGTETQLMNTPTRLAAPAWSPDGTRVFVNAQTKGQSGLMAVAADGGNGTMLTPADEDVFPFRVSWLSADEYVYTADGKLLKRKVGQTGVTAIPFQATVAIARRNYQRKQYDFTTTSPRPVRGIKGPAVSPDGRQIAFAALGDIWLLTKGNPQPRALTNDPYLDAEPVWSPDGSKLAFVSDRQGNMDLWIQDVQTKQLTRVVDLPDDVNLPSWSPDGSRVAFYQGDARNVWGRGTLHTVDVKTGKVEKCHESVFVPSQPSWSPDGRYIALSALDVYSSRYREGVSEILLVSLEGKPDRYVSPVPERTLGTRGKNGPIWSPDGRMMAYILDGVLWTVPVDAEGNPTGAPKQLTRELADVPTWTGDSKHLVFMATDTLKQVSVADGRIETIPLRFTWQPRQPAGQLVVHAGRLFDGRSKAYRTNVDVLIEGNRIRAIEPHKPGRSGRLIDASDKTVIPGLFEMHTHQNAMCGEPQGRLWLSYGITSVREPGADPYDALERKEAWASGRRWGPRQFFTGGLTDGTRIYYGLATSIGSAAHLDLELNRAVRLDFDLIKTYVRMPDDRQQYITQFAHAHGLPVSSHEIFPAMRYEVDAVEHIGGTSRRGYSPKITAMNRTYQDVIELLAKSQMNITPTASLQGGFFVLANRDTSFFSNRQFRAFYPETYAGTLQAGAAQFAKINPGYLTNFGNLQQDVKALIKAGAHVTTGTDSPFVPYGMSLHTELQSFVDGGLTPYEALRSATLWAAEAVGVSQDLGSLEPGKLADLVIVAGDPLTTIRDAWNVEMVIKNGETHTIDDLLKKP
ncbi:amidohydrolase [Fibrisoma limi BUZ 3]|uniref:Amidohydrolase n=1 Tax=Fibrisoma limi BUZ 3 TaxID=1185876 RepID=I2GFL1_9BACT|nr:DPP IV N-terminal domain-containing protein [Fibrisoma limi]CCH52686.1 amidohydrolase [Fibrisoma limi BUZ 3]